MKLAIFITADPKSGDDAVGRTFNALGLAAEALKADDEVAIVFAGAGTRWPAELTQLGHPLHGLYDSVRPAVVGASCGCGQVFGATEGLQAAGVTELKQNGAAVGAPAAIASIRQYLADGWQTLVF